MGDVSHVADIRGNSGAEGRDAIRFYGFLRFSIFRPFTRNSKLLLHFSSLLKLRMGAWFRMLLLMTTR